MPTNRRRVSRNYQNQEIPQWQFEYLKSGSIPETDEVFDRLPQIEWPQDITPNPWQVIYFETHGAKKLWKRIRNDVDPSDFEYASKKFDEGRIRGWTPKGWRWF